MPVVFRESTRKMTPKNIFLVLFALFGCLEGITGAAFSNVLVQRSDVVPVEYINYNPSLSFAHPQIAELSASPLESVIPVPSVPAVVSPCLAPCVIPSSSGPGLARLPSTSNAKIITYKSPVSNVPVVVTNKEAPRGYQYAYAVFDDQTGDKKSQSEHSDGSIVRGQYSFIQPDGFRREVVYTADDLKGFNAVVRNISPQPEEPEEKKVEEAKTQSKPCPDPQNEHLTHIHSEETSSKEVQAEIEHIEEHDKEHNPEQKSEENVEKKPEEAIEKDKEIEEKPHEEEIHETKDSVDNSPPDSNDLISYNDIIKCLQNKLRGANTAVSPLTYVIIPSFKGPC